MRAAPPCSTSALSLKQIMADSDSVLDIGLLKSEGLGRSEPPALHVLQKCTCCSPATLRQRLQRAPRILIRVLKIFSHGRALR